MAVRALAGAALMIRGVINIKSIDSDFDERGVVARGQDPDRGSFPASLDAAGPLAV